MISSDKYVNALKALHRVLILTRQMGYESRPGPEIARVLDIAEYLVVTIMAPGDKTSEFQDQIGLLADMDSTFGSVVSEFDGP